MSIEQLDQLGIRYNQAYEYVGEGKERHPVDLPAVPSLELPLTDQQWCSLCMSERGSYVGGCCGNMSALQDVINYVFRIGGGWISTDEFLQVAERCLDHDGFEEFTDTAVLAEALENGPLIEQQKSAWWKIGATWQAASDVLTVKRGSSSPRPKDVTDFEDAVHAAAGVLMVLRYDRLFAPKEGEEDDGQHKADQRVRLATLWAALLPIQQELERRLPEGLDGFGLRHQDGHVGETRRGFCLYGSQAAAQRVLDLWKQDQSFKPEDWTVQPFRVTIQDGLVWL